MRGLMSLVNHKDIPVVIGINERGIYVIDHVENVIVFFIFLSLIISFVVSFFLI